MLNVALQCCTYSAMLISLLQGPIFFAGSNHYGIAGWYAMRAAEQGLVVQSFSLLVKGIASHQQSHQ